MKLRLLLRNSKPSRTSFTNSGTSSKRSYTLVVPIYRLSRSALNLTRSSNSSTYVLLALSMVTSYVRQSPPLARWHA